LSSSQGRAGGRKSTFLAVDRDVVAIKGLAHQTVRSHHLARLRVGRERVSQRRKREVDLLLAARRGALDGPSGASMAQPAVRTRRISVLSF